LIAPPPQNKVNGILKERWFALSAEEKTVWKKWQQWDERRYQHQLRLFERKKKKKKQKRVGSPQKDVSSSKMDVDTPPVSPHKHTVESATKSESSISIPKKAKRSFDAASPMIPCIPKKRRFGS